MESTEGKRKKIEHMDEELIRLTGELCAAFMEAGIVPGKGKSEEAKRRPGGGGGKMQLQIIGKNFGIVKNCFTAAETMALIGRFVRDSTVLVKVEIEGGEEERGGDEDSGF